MDDARVLPAGHRVDAETSYRMAEAGIFAKGDRVELIEGDMIDMAPIGQEHVSAACGARLVARRAMCFRRADQRRQLSRLRPALPCPNPYARRYRVVDNLSSHKGVEVRRALRATRAKLFFMPPCSPDLNPIQQVLRPTS